MRRFPIPGHQLFILSIIKWLKRLLAGQAKVIDRVFRILFCNPGQVPLPFQIAAPMAASVNHLPVRLMVGIDKKVTPYFYREKITYFFQILTYFETLNFLGFN